MKRSSAGRKIEKALQEGIRWAKNELILPEVTMERVKIVKLLQRHSLMVSMSNSKRVVALGGIKLNGRIITDMQSEVIIKNGDVLEVGSKKVVL